PRDTFVKELTETASLKETLNEITRKIEKLRPTALHMEDTDRLDLKTIADHIETAVKKHNKFKADMKIPIGFFPNEKLGMKVPYPDNKEAVDSVKVIIRLLRSAIGSNAARMQLLAFKKILNGNYYQTPPTQEKKLYGPQIPKNIFLPSTNKKNIRLSIPHGEDNDSKRSVNEILELMALVGGSPKLKKSWNTFRDNLNRQLDVIENPQAWGPVGEEGGDTRKQAVLDAVEAHNESLNVKNRSKEVADPGQKRPADGPHERVPGPRHETGQGAGSTKTSLEALRKTPPLQPQPDSEGGGEDKLGDSHRRWRAANVLPDGKVVKWPAPPHLQRQSGGSSSSGSNTRD
ncbi:hypothetical protein H0H93_012451, partial [Arthromyces matolae]